MNSLKSELISDTDSFEHLARKLMSKKIVTLGKEYIENMKADFFVKPRDLLSSFMIYKFPDDAYEVSTPHNFLAQFGTPAAQ